MKLPWAVLLLVVLACTSTPGLVSIASGFVGFLENRGQVDQAVKYYAPGSRVSVYLTEDAVVLDLREGLLDSLRGSIADSRLARGLVGGDGSPGTIHGCAVYIRFDRANPHPLVEATGETETKYNCFLGNDPSRWRTNVPAYSEVRYRGVFPGLDLVFREDDRGRLTYEVDLQPCADKHEVQFRCEGAERVTQGPDGSLLAETPVGSLREERMAAAHSAGVFVLDLYDHGGLVQGCGAAIMDDPSALTWSALLGGSGGDEGSSLVLDASDDIIVAGTTRSSDFPTTPGAYDLSWNGGHRDVFVGKLSAAGSALTWCTFLGGTRDDVGTSVALDAFDNILVSGVTQSSDFPVTLGAYDTSFNGDWDAYVAKICSSGSTLVWSTFLGGSNVDAGYSLRLDGSGNAVVSGGTSSPDFPTTPGAYDTSLGGNDDAFVAAMSCSGGTLVWSTFLGGAGYDCVYSLALEASGNPIVTGTTSSTDFPTTPGAYDISFNGTYDVFVATVSSSGSALVWSTFLGGTGYEYGYSLALDELGNAVIAGTTVSSDFPVTPGAYDESFNGGDDVFVAKASPSGSSLLWSTFLGGRANDEGYSLALDAVGNAVVTGSAQSSDFPVTPGAYDSSHNGNWDAFAAEVHFEGNALVLSTLLGGEDYDEGRFLALDSWGSAVMIGHTWSSDFPMTPGASDTSHQGLWDVFVAKLDVGCCCTRPRDGWVGSAYLCRSFPNPSMGSTTVQFYLRTQQRVSVALYDGQGRLVKRLADGVAGGGMHSVEWDGRSGAGAPAAPGIYFIRMEAGTYRATRKVVVLR